MNYIYTQTTLDVEHVYFAVVVVGPLPTRTCILDEHTQISFFKILSCMINSVNSVCLILIFIDSWVTGLQWWIGTLHQTGDSCTSCWITKYQRMTFEAILRIPSMTCLDYPFHSAPAPLSGRDGYMGGLLLIIAIEFFWAALWIDSLQNGNKLEWMLVLGLQWELS